MNKYTYALISEIGSHFDEDTALSPQTLISELFEAGFDDVDWMETLMQLQMLYAINIPDELADEHDQTLESFASELSALPVLPDEHYPDYYRACIQVLEEWYQFKNGLHAATSPKELEKLEREFEENTRVPYGVISSLFS
ncbi:MAG: hypothetical protein LAT67_00740 [Balneolales bacterium]|nr:hypothetical protein [Balneolales bacterium]